MTRNFERGCWALPSSASISLDRGGAGRRLSAQGALGTSRVLAVDPAATPRVGLKSFPQTLPLGDREVVLTFDDGPWPATTPQVLAALAQECVRATFFLIGKPASEHPAWCGESQPRATPSRHHTWTPSQSEIHEAGSKPIGEIDKGIAAVEMALHGDRDHDAEHAVLSLSLL